MSRTVSGPGTDAPTRDGLPVLVGPGRTTKEVLEAKFGPLELLGIGGYGEAWLARNGRVIKSTSSAAETHCVRTILENNLKSPWLPRLYHAGWFEWVRFTYCPEDSWEDIPEDCPSAGYGPVFWYEREAVNHFPLAVAELALDIYRYGYEEAAKRNPGRKKGKPAEQWKNAARIVRAISTAMKELPRSPGLAPIDAALKNWGVTASGRIVLRDLACGTADLMFDDEEQNSEVDVMDWPPPSLWDGVKVPRTVKGPPPPELREGLDLTSADAFRESLRRLAPERIAALDAAIKQADHDVRFPGPGWKALYHGAPTKLAARIEQSGFQLGPGQRTMGFMDAPYTVQNKAIFLTDSKPLAAFFGSNRAEHPSDYRVIECSADVSKVLDAEKMPKELRALGRRLIKAWEGSAPKRIPQSQFWWLLDQPEFVDALKAAGYTGMHFPETRAIRRESGSLEGRTWALLDPGAIRIRRRVGIYGLDRIRQWLLSTRQGTTGGPPPDELLILQVTHPDLDTDPKLWGAAIAQNRREEAVVSDAFKRLLAERKAIEITDPQRSLVLLAMQQTDGVIRVGRFDARGPSGHQEIPPGEKQGHELVKEVTQNLRHYPDDRTITIHVIPPSRSIVDFWMRQPLGKWGAQVLRVVQHSNELRMQGRYEEAHEYDRTEMEKIGPQPEEVPLPDTVGGIHYPELRRHLEGQPRRVAPDQPARLSPGQTREALEDARYQTFRKEVIAAGELRAEGPYAYNTAIRPVLMRFLEPFGVMGSLMAARVALEIAIPYWPARLPAWRELSATELERLQKAQRTEELGSDYGPFRVLTYARWRTDEGRSYDERPLPPSQMGFAGVGHATAHDYWDWPEEESSIADQIGFLGYEVGRVFHTAWLGDSSAELTEEERKTFPIQLRLAATASLLSLMRLGALVHRSPRKGELDMLDRWWSEFHRRLAVRDPGQLTEPRWMETTSGPSEERLTRRDEQMASAALGRILMPWREEKETGRGTITLEFPTFTEDWTWIAFEGKQIGAANRAGRILLDLPSNPAAGIAWFTENDQPKISSYWTEELLRRHGALRKLIEVYRQIVSPEVIMVGPFSRAGRLAAEKLADKIEE